MGPYRPHHGLGKRIPFWISTCSTVHRLLSLDQLAPVREIASWKAWFQTEFQCRFPLLNLGSGENKFALYWLYWHIFIDHIKAVTIKQIKQYWNAFSRTYIFCKHSDHGLCMYAFIIILTFTQGYARGICNPVSVSCSAYCTGIMLLPFTCAMMLEKKATKKWNQQFQSQLYIIIYYIYNAVAVGQPSFLEGNLRGIPASIYEAWSSYYELRIFRIWKINEHVENMWKPRFIFASLFSRISNSIPTLWLQVPLVQVRPQPSDPCGGAPSLSHMGKSTSAPSALIQVA